MMVLSLAQVVQAVGGDIVSEFISEFKGLATDTREKMPSKLFIALRGENFDAHEFLEKAVAQGAVALIIDKEPDNFLELKSQVTIIKVKDTLRALQDLALFWRRLAGFKVAAITGSNGKTTTKQFCADILKTKFNISYSEGSFNNHWGVPITLLNAPKDADLVIVEMGMNAKGEIKRLCEIAEPNIVLVTTVGYSHVGGLGSLEDVKEAKEEIYKYSPCSIAIFNVSNEHTMEMYESALANNHFKKRMTFSNFSIEACDVILRMTAMDLHSLSVTGEIGGVEGQCTVPVFGRQNINNLMAAASIAFAAGMRPEDIWQALPLCKTIWGRNQLLKLKSGALAIFDGYNSNMESVDALVKNLYEVEITGKKFIVLGEMFELGFYTRSFHHQLGLLVGRSLLDYVWFMGPSFKDFKQGLESSGFSKNIEISEGYKETLATDLRNMLNEGDIVAIKGSRAMKLERVLQVLEPVDFNPK